MKEIFKKDKGITLVILVVTVIVVIILAGVSFTITSKDKGIIESSKKAINGVQDQGKQQIGQMQSMITNMEQEAGIEAKEPEEKVVDFNYTGEAQEWKVPMTGRYKLEVWGAQGGKTTYEEYIWYGGNGGYSTGEMNITEGTKLYIYVGNKGQDGVNAGTSTTTGGYNGGGNGAGGTQYFSAGAGGGATDIREISGNWNDTNSLNSRIIVAGGGRRGRIWYKHIWNNIRRTWRRKQRNTGNLFWFICIKERRACYSNFSRSRRNIWHNKIWKCRTIRNRRSWSHWSRRRSRRRRRLLWRWPEELMEHNALVQVAADQDIQVV